MPEECPFCGAEDTELVMEYRIDRLWLCRCCGKDFHVRKPQDQIDREREMPSEERWR